jgi:hypothetical protein
MIPTSDNPDGTIGPDIAALMESFSGELRESNNDGFEVIYKVSKNSFIDFHVCYKFRLILKNYLKLNVVHH